MSQAGLKGVVCWLLVALLSGCAASASLAPGSTQVSNTDGMTLRYIPAGEIRMGNAHGAADEQPEHTVYLDAFWIDETEVTNAMFQKFVTETRYQAEGNWQEPSMGPPRDLKTLGNHPVVAVSWKDAQAYCAWAGRRLPTEAEWEKAARGTDGRLYPWGNESPDETRVTYNWEVPATTPVGRFPLNASPYGALDMVGNVWEWVADWYSENYYASSPTRNPTGPTSGDYHVLRGGCHGTLMEANTTKRGNDYPYVRYCYFGFRCALRP